MEKLPIYMVLFVVSEDAKTDSQGHPALLSALVSLGKGRRRESREGDKMRRKNKLMKWTLKNPES